MGAHLLGSGKLFQESRAVNIFAILRYAAIAIALTTRWMGGASCSQIVMSVSTFNLEISPRTFTTSNRMSWRLLL
jgi:hypothetical protein